MYPISPFSVTLPYLWLWTTFYLTAHPESFCYITAEGRVVGSAVDVVFGRKVVESCYESGTVNFTATRIPKFQIYQLKGTFLYRNRNSVKYCISATLLWRTRKQTLKELKLCFDRCTIFSLVCSCDISNRRYQSSVFWRMAFFSFLRKWSFETVIEPEYIWCSVVCLFDLLQNSVRHSENFLLSTVLQFSFF